MENINQEKLTSHYKCSAVNYYLNLLQIQWDNDHWYKTYALTSVFFILTSSCSSIGSHSMWKLFRWSKYKDYSSFQISALPWHLERKKLHHKSTFMSRLTDQQNAKSETDFMCQMWDHHKICILSDKTDCGLLRETITTQDDVQMSKLNYFTCQTVGKFH